jgi:predicted DNA-binding protein
MVQNQNELALAKRIVQVTRSPNETAELLNILSNQKMQTAASVLKELLTSTDERDLGAVSVLAERLTRGTPAEKATADELLMLLNTERHRETALKRLKKAQ